MLFTRQLIAFAFLAERFEETGDLVQGLVSLFAPLIKNHEGQEFSPEIFSTELSDYYGIKVHPWVVEDWIGRLEKENLIERVQISEGIYSIRYAKGQVELSGVQEADVNKLVEIFTSYAQKKFREHGISLSNEALAKGLFERLVRMDFLDIILKPDSHKEPPVYSAKTLHLAKPQEESNVQDNQEAHIDFVCADFILATSKEDKQLFDLLLRIACGALVAEVILDFQAPSEKVEFKGLTVYLDAPFIMDLLDLSYEENVRYSTELFKQLKESGARVAVFPHSVKEMQGAIKAPLDRYERGEPATGPTGSRLRSAAFRAYARSVLSNVEIEIRDLGISMAPKGLATSTSVLQYFTKDEESELSRRIGFYENVAARERDASSIAIVVRLRQRIDVPMHDFARCKSIFLTRNSRLANKSTDHLVQQRVVGERSVPPCIHDRYMAGLLWITHGGKGKELSKQRLLANCASAVSPRQDVVRRMHTFLTDLDEVKAHHFQALMTSKKAAHYLMNKTLGDAKLITKENATQVYEEVEKIAGEKVALEKDREIGKLRDEYEEKLAARVAEQVASTEALKRAHEEKYAAGEETLKAQLEAREQRRRAEDLEDQLSELRADRDRIDLSILQHSVDAGRKAERKAQLLVLLIIVGASILLTIIMSFAPLLFGHETLGATVATAICIMIGGLLAGAQFWIFPEKLFGHYVATKRNEALFRKAKELSATGLIDNYEIDWSSGTITKK